jgi:hypothetical protein
MFGRMMTSNTLRMSLLATLTVLILILVACGSNNTTTGGSQPSGAPTEQTQKCGSVNTYPNGKLANEPTAKQAENCFWQAYQHCHTATLSFAKRGLDAGAIHAFTIKSNNGQCTISDAIQTYIAPNPPKAGNTYTCTGLTQQVDGLHFASCGELGDIVVPDSPGQ